MLYIMCSVIQTNLLSIDFADFQLHEYRPLRTRLQSALAK